MKKYLVLATALLVAIRVTAADLPSSLITTWNGSQLIPDNNASGVAFPFSLNAPGPVIITNVTVDLTIAGGWNGDLYAYLSHGSGFSVLLNRVGRTSVNPDGSTVSGMTVSLSDSYFTDIHNASSNPLTGNFAPDGRNVNPFNALNTDPRNATLGNFYELDPNGSWTLYFADLSPLAVATVQSWTVNVGITVPEPGSLTLLALAAMLGFARRFVRR